MARRRRRRKLPPVVRLPRAYRRHPAVTLILAVLVAVVLLERGRRDTPSVPASDDYSRYHNQVFMVVRVVDGDTVDIDAPDADKSTTRIRLWGVDTPEVTGSPRGEMYWGQEASEFAKSTLHDQRVRVELVRGDTRGKYGRLLAYVYDASAGTMFNESLLLGGYAYADPRFEHPLLERFIALERNARAKAAGLWRDVSIEQMPKWRQRRER